MKHLSCLTLSASGDKDLDSDFEAAADEEPKAVAEEPPEPLSKSAVDKRLRRLMTPRADGSLLVPDEIKLQWADPLQRDKVKLLFEKCAHQPDQGAGSKMT